MLQDAMRTVATEGGGKPAQVAGAEVGGKTGTAQRGENNSLPPLAWFTSYAQARRQADRGCGGGRALGHRPLRDRRRQARRPGRQKMMEAWLKK